MSLMLRAALIDASANHKKRFRQEIFKLDLSEGQPKVLVFLLKYEGCLQKELAEMCYVKPATMTSILKNMEKRELIKKETVHVSGGKKAYSIYFTELGREKALQVEKIVNDLEIVSFNNFSIEEKEQIIELLRRVAKNLED